MAKRKNGFDTTALLKYAERLDELGGSDAVVVAAGVALRTAKNHINAEMERRLKGKHLPAGGKYSTGKTLETIDRSTKIDKQGTKLSLPMGFREGEGGAGVFLLYGTPKMKPASGLNNALKGKTARKKLNEQMEKALETVLEHYMGGGG